MKIYLRRCHALMVEDGAFSHKIEYFTFFAIPGEARGCSTNTFVIKSLIRSSFVKISLRRHQALMVEGNAFGHKKGYFAIEECQNCITGSRVTTILLNEWIVYWWSFSRGGSAINWATPYSFGRF